MPTVKSNRNTYIVILDSCGKKDLREHLKLLRNQAKKIHTIEIEKLETNLENIVINEKKPVIDISLCSTKNKLKGVELGYLIGIPVIDLKESFFSSSLNRVEYAKALPHNIFNVLRLFKKRKAEEIEITDISKSLYYSENLLTVIISEGKEAYSLWEIQENKLVLTDSGKKLLNLEPLKLSC